MQRAPITQYLGQLAAGDESAEANLLPLVYERLHGLAQAMFAEERPDHTLAPTALVHDAWMKLAGNDHANWQNRAQFFAVSAKVMRRLLVDHARARAAQKRGGDLERVRLETEINFGPAGAPQEGSDLLDLDSALEKLSNLDERQSQIVELRFFSGLTVGEVAECLHLSVRTIESEWTMAKAWLKRELRPA